MSNERFAITISHQIGSGGAYLGQKIAERFSIPFIDRDILRNVAGQLNLAEADLEKRDEHVSSFWESLSRMVLVTDPIKTVTLESYMVTDKELFKLESEYIARIADETSAVFLGRCSRYVLRNHPKRISIFVHANLPARVERLGQIFHLSTAEAEKFIETNDRDRAAYVQSFTKQNWLDARLYDLSINTSILGFEKSAELVTNFIESKVTHPEKA